MYKYNFNNNKIIDLQTNRFCEKSIILGIYLDSTRSASKEILLNSLIIDENIAVAKDCFGNFAKVFSTNDELVFLTSGFYGVYFTIIGKDVYFSENAKEMEDTFGNIENINLDSCFYYISSGNTPPLEYTFFSNIKRVPAEHIVRVRRDGNIEKHKYTFEYESKLSKKDYLAQYTDIVETEARLWADYFRRDSIVPYTLISGVDSFNVCLALLPHKYNKVMHANVNKLQKFYVNEFVDTNEEISYTEVVLGDNLKTKEQIWSDYKQALRPYLKFRTDDALDKCLNKKGVEVVLRGDFTGLTMAAKSYNSTLEQHYIFGRYLMGMRKRMYFLESNLKRINRHTGKKNLYNFMISLFMPSTSFNSTIPFKGLREATGLKREEKDYYMNTVLHTYMKSFGESVDWKLDYNHPNPGKLFRSFKREFYSPGLPEAAMHAKNIYGMEQIYLFSSTKAQVFCDNYRLPLSDVIGSKKVVYDYFKGKAGVSIQKLGKKAVRHLSYKERLKNLLITCNNYTPAFFKKSLIYQIIKNKLHKTINYRQEIGSIDINELIDNGDVLPLSECTNNDILKKYFKNIEKSMEICNKCDIAYASMIQERYLNLSMYLNARIKK